MVAQPMFFFIESSMGCDIAGVFSKLTDDDRPVKQDKLFTVYARVLWRHICLNTGRVMHIVSGGTAERMAFCFSVLSLIAMQKCSLYADCSLK